MFFCAFAVVRSQFKELLRRARKLTTAENRRKPQICREDRALLTAMKNVNLPRPSARQPQRRRKYLWNRREPRLEPQKWGSGNSIL